MHNWVYLVIAIILLILIALYVRSQRNKMEETTIAVPENKDDYVIQPSTKNPYQESDLLDDEEDEDEDQDEDQDQDHADDDDDLDLDDPRKESPEPTKKVTTPFTGKLTDQEVRTILAIRNPDFQKLAIQYDVSPKTIRNVWMRKTYKHVN